MTSMDIKFLCSAGLATVGVVTLAVACRKGFDKSLFKLAVEPLVKDKLYEINEKYNKCSTEEDIEKLMNQLISIDSLIYFLDDFESRSYYTNFYIDLLGKLELKLEEIQDCQAC